jgi:hypothetical protein
MPNILDKVARDLSEFRPATPTQYVALQVARKLNRLHKVRVYAALFERYTLDLLVRSFHKVMQDQPESPTRALEEEVTAQYRKERSGCHI